MPGFTAPGTVQPTGSLCDTAGAGKERGGEKDGSDGTPGAEGSKWRGPDGSPCTALDSGVRCPMPNCGRVSLPRPHRMRLVTSVLHSPPLSLFAFQISQPAVLLLLLLALFSPLSDAAVFTLVSLAMLFLIP